MTRPAAPLRRVARHLFGPPLPPLASLWAVHRRRALSAAACVALPLVLGLVLGRLDLGSAAAFGGFTAVYGHALPYRRRAGVSAGVGVVLTAAVALGGLAGPHPVALALVLGLLAAATTAATAIWHVGPPGPLIAVLIGGSASALGAAPAVLALHGAAAAAGAAFAWVVVMAPWTWDPAGPERRALAAADAAVTAAERGPRGAVRPDAAARAVRLADVAVAGGSRRRPSLQARLEEVEARFLRALPPVDLGHAAPPPAARPAPRRHVPVWAPTAARIGLGVGAAGLVAAALHLQSTYWASATAVAVLLGTDARHTRARALHRATGTLLGTVLTGLLFWLHLPAAATILAVAVLQVGVELLVASQYVLAVALITPVALSLVHLGNPARAGSELIGVRLAETLVGMVVGLAAGLLLFPRTGSRRLPAAVGRTVDRLRAAADARPGSPADRALRAALAEQHEVAAAARAELFDAAGAEAELHRSRQVADLGWALLGARARGEDALAARLARRVRSDLG